MSAEIGRRFEFHLATSRTGPLHQEVRLRHRQLAQFIEEGIPESRERALALTALQESMWCNAAVAYR